MSRPKRRGVALKTNTLDWVLMSPNLTLDTRLSRRVTFEIGVAGNPLDKTVYGSDIKLKTCASNRRCATGSTARWPATSWG